MLNWALSDPDEEVRSKDSVIALVSVFMVRALYRGSEGTDYPFPWKQGRVNMQPPYQSRIEDEGEDR
jgi:hypothetical protein